MTELSIGNILAGVIASAIFFAFGYFTTKAVSQYYNAFSARRVWKQFRKSADAIYVILSTRKGSYTRTAARVSLKEMDAFVRLSETSKNIGRKIIHFPSNTNLSNLNNYDLVLLGGPRANEISDFLWDLIVNKTPFQVDLNMSQIRVGNNVFQPKINDDDIPIEDFGILAKLRNADNHRRFIVISAGCHGFATRGGVDFFTDAGKIRLLERQVGSREFAAIVKVTVAGGSQISSEIVECSVISRMGRWNRIGI